MLETDADRVDALRFRRLVDQAREPGLADAPRADLLREALDLWRGTPLADVPGEWAARVREGWVQRRTDVVVAWAQAELRLGRPDGVIATASELISEYPLVESLVAVYMRALAAAGRGAEALEAYARTQRLLAEQLGADPGAELRGLHQAILRGELDRARRAEPAPTPPPAAPPAPAPVGRGGRFGPGATAAGRLRLHRTRRANSPTSTPSAPAPTSSRPRW